MYTNMCIHIHFFTNLLVFIFACKYISHISHLRAHTHMYICFLLNVCIFNLYVHIYLCLNKLTCRGMFLCTFSNNWPKLATLADNGAKNKRRQKTPVAQGWRDLLVYQRVRRGWQFSHSSAGSMSKWPSPKMQMFGWSMTSAKWWRAWECSQLDESYMTIYYIYYIYEIYIYMCVCLKSAGYPKSTR